MPRWLYDQLDAGPKISVINRIGRDGRLLKQEQVQNETPGIISILAQLSALDRTVKKAYYCHPSTIHIGKTPKEGGFCGYRNIQMLLSYIQGAKAQGHEEFPGRTPGILKLQDNIEDAWDKGINEIGRVQTGGIRGTRKYIGTPEVYSLAREPPERLTFSIGTGFLSQLRNQLCCRAIRRQQEKWYWCSREIAHGNRAIFYAGFGQRRLQCKQDTSSTYLSPAAGPLHHYCRFRTPS